MNIAQKNHFYRVFTAYRLGIIKKEQHGEIAISHEEQSSDLRHQLDFNQLSLCACLGLSSPQERLASQETGQIAYRGFAAARASDFELAQTHFTNAWDLWSQLKPGFCSIRLVGIIEAYQAYLEYRLSRYNEARERLERALDSSFLLERSYGLTLFELQRMQLGHNLARVDWQSGLLEKAFELAGALVAYLQGGRRDLPFHREWRRKWMLSSPTYLRKAMISQIAGEAINQLIVQSKHTCWEVFFNEIMATEDWPSSQFFADPRLGQWMRARQARLLGAFRKYMNILEEILPPGPRGLGTLYYSILVDFVDFCSTDQSIAARKVIELLYQDSTKWKDFPEILAQRLRKIFEERSAASLNVAICNGLEVYGGDKYAE